MNLLQLIHFSSYFLLSQRTYAEIIRNHRHMTQRLLKNPCLVLISKVDYEDGIEAEQTIQCELRGEDLNGMFYNQVNVKGLNGKWARKNKVESGVTTLFAENSIIDDTLSELEIPLGQTMQLASLSDAMQNPHRRSYEYPNLPQHRHLATGIRKTLIIRAIASDTATTSSESTLSTSVSSILVRYSRCSEAQLQFQPITDNVLIGSDGAYTVNITTTTVNGASFDSISNAVLNQATSDLGTLSNIVDHVIVCLPPGTSGLVIGSSYYNHWLSFFSNEWCKSQWLVIRHIGYNLNMGLSRETSAGHGDYSCSMGFDDDPLPQSVCFNGPKTYQLGWYSQHHLDLPISGSYSWDGNLIGFAEKSSASSSDIMIVRIITSTDDIYIHFNRRIGTNLDTPTGQDQVLVTKKTTGVNNSPSDLLARLSIGSVHTIPNFSGDSTSLSITVNSITLGTAPGKANISVRSAYPSPAPTTGAPTLTPTSSPTSLPTLQPSAAPTSSPTLLPTPPPTLEPTSAPTSSPTSLPSPEPTISPTLSPTIIPTSLPSPEPTISPTLLPTIVPTSLPSPEPTISPTMLPTIIPTSLPSPEPTISPTLLPTIIPTSLPSPAPTSIPTTAISVSPIPAPTLFPTPFPSPAPSSLPTAPPTTSPTTSPTLRPSPKPTTSSPTPLPTPRPSPKPTTLSPTQLPTSNPSPIPTPSTPTPFPTAELTDTPTTPLPTLYPSSLTTTLNPTEAPTPEPTILKRTSFPTTRGRTLAPPPYPVTLASKSPLSTISPTTETITPTEFDELLLTSPKILPTAFNSKVVNVDQLASTSPMSKPATPVNEHTMEHIPSSSNGPTPSIPLQQLSIPSVPSISPFPSKERSTFRRPSVPIAWSPIL